MIKKYYFYRKSVEPKEYDFFDHTKGIVGYSKKQAGKHFLHGTIKDLDEQLSFKRPAKVGSMYGW